jgi:8-amino-7-oxononanoate synthase
MDRIEKVLAQRKEEGLFRVLRAAERREGGRIYRDGRELVDFASNDYLGLSSHPKLKEASRKAVEEFGTSCSASRLLSGDLRIHHELEKKIALLKGKESALVFNSGYQANVGIISSLYKKGDAIFSDRLNHSSILDGILLSGAKLFRFRHNDANHLELLLKKQADKFENRLIVTETIFSMDGDRAPLKEIVELKERYGCEVMVDEAHATGIFGKDGSGVVAEEGLADRIDLIMGTFGKALGSFGAYIAGSKKMIEYLVNTCRSFIYSTALPPCVVAANLAALELVKDEPFRRKTLLENATFFRGELETRGLEVRGVSQIVPLIVKDVDKAVTLSSRLLEKGYWVLPIRPPTVPVGQSRLRFSLSYCHEKEILQDVIEETSKAVYHF